MPSYLEYEGKNEEDVVKKACKKLNLSKEKLKYSVISYGSTGIFGLVGSKKAKIRVQLPKHLDKDVDNKDNIKKDEINNNSITKDSMDEKETPDIPDNAIELGKEILQKIIDAITTEAKISIEKTQDIILFNIEGGNAAILIGRHGQTLEAIQQLVEKIVNKHSKQRMRIQIDIERYMEKRRIKLEQLASRLAEKSKNNGKPVTVGQMNPYERKIVHLALKNDNNIRTKSIGEGIYKKLVIFPKKNYPRKRR